MKIAALLLIVMGLSGCELLLRAEDQAAKRIGDGVTWYCENLTPDLREHFREKVNEYAVPNTVTVTCDGSFVPLISGYPTSGTNPTDYLIRTTKNRGDALKRFCHVFAALL